jgi:antitoxin component of MazEF toxin-antitoxin module
MSAAMRRKSDDRGKGNAARQPTARPRSRRAGMKIAMWGNCLAVRIPRFQAEQTGLSVGTEVVVERVAEGVLIRPAHRRPTLKELVGKITSRNRHGEVDSGGPVGREII